MRSLFMLLLFVSCGYKTTALPDGLTVRNQPVQGAVDFATVSAQIFGPSCVRCHGSAGGVNLSTYAGVKAALSRIAGAVNSGAMPPGGTLSQPLKNILNAWISDGAPEVAQTGTTTGGNTGNLQLDFATVKSRILLPSCIGCHGSAGGINLTSYVSVQRSLTRVRNMVNSNRMPPSSPLPETEKNLLNLWIDAGAPEIAGGTTGGGSGGTTGENEDPECEDDDRLMSAGLVLRVGESWVYDQERELMRKINDGCDDEH